MFNAKIIALALCSLSLSGCAGLIQESGLNLHELSTRQKVRTTLGEPAQSGSCEGKGLEKECTFEEFLTHRKIAYCSDSYMNLYFKPSYGLSEFTHVPIQIVHSGCGMISGQKVRFNYDADGYVSGISVNDAGYLGPVVP